MEALKVVNESPHIGLDIGKYVESNKETKTPDEIAWDITYFSREARNVPFDQRANTIVISLDKFRKLVKPESNLATDLATYEIYKWAKQVDPTVTLSTETASPSTQDILKKMLPLMDFNPQSAMIWLSPKGQIYQEARINVYQTIEVNGQKYLFFWSTPSSHSDQACLAFHQNLLQFTTENIEPINNVEELRISPLPIKIPQTESLTNFLEKHIALPEVWKEISSGQIIEDTLRDFTIIKDLVLAKYPQIISQKTEYQNRLVGAELEREMQYRLNISLLSGIHGGLNQDMLQNFLSKPGRDFFMLTGRLLSENNLTSTEKVHCGACGEYPKGQKFNPGFKCPKKSGND